MSQSNVASGLDPATAQRTRVLVVEDDADSAALLTALLQRVGYDAQFAHDGPAALAAARVWLPSVVLLDLGLPGMSGYEIARVLRAEANGRDLHVIALTASSDDTARQRSLEAGCECHLVKGVRLEALLATIESSGLPRCRD